MEEANPNPDEAVADNDYDYWINLDEEFANGETVDDFSRLLMQDGIDVEHDSILHNLLEDNERIHLKRQLGDWIEVETDSVNQ